MNSRKQIFKESFLFCRENVCCVYSLESPHRGDSNKYTQHTIILYKSEKTFKNIPIPPPPPPPELALTLSGSNFPCLEQMRPSQGF